MATLHRIDTDGKIAEDTTIRSAYRYAITNAGELSGIWIVEKADGGALLELEFYDYGRKVVTRRVYEDWAEYAVLINQLKRSRVLAHYCVQLRPVNALNWRTVMVYDL